MNNPWVDVKLFKPPFNSKLELKVRQAGEEGCEFRTWLGQDHKGTIVGPRLLSHDSMLVRDLLDTMRGTWLITYSHWRIYNE